jgi:hypothetical protein
MAASTTPHNQKQAQALEPAPELALETDANAGAHKVKDDTTKNNKMEEKDTIDTATSAPVKKDDNDVKSETVAGMASKSNMKNSTNPSTNNSTKKKQKRKRGGMNRQELERQWKQERYDKLVYGARKDIYKQSKLVRTFYLQKCIRKNNDSTTEKQQELAEWKSLPLETLVVQEAVRRLGVTHLNPNYHQEQEQQQQHDQEQESTTAPTTTTTTTTTTTAEVEQDASTSSTFYNSKISLLLQHKKMEACLEHWNEKVTDFRRWCLRLSEKTEPGYKTKPTEGGKKKKKRKPNDPSEAPAVASLDTSMFCSLGGQDDDDDDDEQEAEHKYSQYGPGAFAVEVPSKKNRMGQRARRAKHQAIQAKKDGKEYSSINWRAKKQVQDGEGGESFGVSHTNSSSNSNSQSQRYHSGAASAAAPKQSQKNREEKDAASAHPSWAAKKAQKDTIVEFQGTKITF